MKKSDNLIEPECIKIDCKIDFNQLRKFTKYDYETAKPYPHLIIDNFIKDKRLLADVVLSLPKPKVSSSKLGEYRNRATCFSISEMPPLILNLFNILYSEDFVKYLEYLCGCQLVKNLNDIICSDGSLRGAGLHQTTYGGFLDRHLDPPAHHEQGWSRPVNAILFLGPEWTEDDGGHLELWDQHNMRCEKRIAPFFNRLVIMANTESSFHAVAEVASPSKVRSSIASFYFDPNSKKEAQRAYFPSSARIFSMINKLKSSEAPIEYKKFAAQLFAELTCEEHADFDRKVFYKNAGIVIDDE